MASLKPKKLLNVIKKRYPLESRANLLLKSKKRIGRKRRDRGTFEMRDIGGSIPRVPEQF